MDRRGSRTPLLPLLLMAALLVTTATARAGEPWENTVVDSKAVAWRVFMQWRTPRIVTADDEIVALREAPDPRAPKKYEDRTPVAPRATAAPPDDWRTVAFDAGSWPRRKGPFGAPFGRHDTLWTTNGPADLALICLRGSFDVKDPARARDLRVDLAFHGGAVITVNGAELKRLHIPKGEAVKPDALAEAYGRDAYINDRVPDIGAVRLRKAEVLIPSKMLKEGVNVVAVEVHAAPTRQVVELGQAPPWRHAAVHRARVGSAFGMTPRDAATTYDEPEKVVRKPGSHVLNNSTGYWRVASRWKTAELVSEDGAPRPLREKYNRYHHKKDEDRKVLPVIVHGDVPAGWEQPGYDDGDWALVRGRLGPSWGGRCDIYSPGNPAQASMICARGRFEVIDPAACKDLEIVLDYQGGAVVYVNGQELKRGHLPAGDLTPDTMAEPYDKRAYVQPNGYLLTPSRDFADYIRTNRIRTLTVPIPQEALRKGVNVVAVEIRRAPVNEVLVTGKYQARAGFTAPGPWPHATLLTAIVRSAGGETPDTAVAKAVQPTMTNHVWNRLTPYRFTLSEFGAPCEPLRPIRLTGARNGAYCGQVIVESDEDLRDVRAAMSDLKGPGAVIPAASVEVSYPNRDARGAGWLTAREFYTLSPDPTAHAPLNRSTKVAQQPVWIKVRVPRDAGPGAYTGTLTINFKIGIPDINLIEKGPVTVPVRLTVHDWTLPDPQDDRTFVDMIESPETVALRYKVPLWSDKHFAYVEKSLKLLAEVGNDAVYVRMINKSHFGDTETWVRHVKQPDGSYKPDFTVFDRYMDLVAKTQGKPRAVILYLWCRYTARGKAPLVTELDPKTGKTQMIEAPAYGTPEGKAFWTPVIAAIRDRLTKRGWDKALMIGLTGDFSGIRGDKIAFFKEVAPGVPWVSQGHGLRSRIGDVPVGYATTVWNTRGPGDPAFGRKHGWRRGGIVCQFPRDIWRARGLIDFRTRPEWNITGSQCGMGRLGGDFWEVLSPKEKPRTGRHHAGGSLANRFPDYGSWGQLVLRTCFTAPGPDGAISTATFEVFRESVQDCETRIFIESALLDEAQRAKLGDDLATRAQAVLDTRTWVLANVQRTRPWFFLSRFRERQDALYALAADVAKALGT